MPVKRMGCMRQQVHGCLKGAFVGRDLSPPNLLEPQEAALQKVSDSLTTYFLDCRCYSSIRRGCVFLFLVLNRSIEKLAVMPYYSRVKQ